MGSALTRIAGAARPSERDAAGGTPTDTTGVSTTNVTDKTAGITAGATAATVASQAWPDGIIRDENVETIEPDLDQCGLDPDPEGRMIEVPLDASRIKESLLTPEEKIQFRALLDRTFEELAVTGKRVAFSPREVLDVMNKVIPYLESEPMLIDDVPFDITIVGDLHGQFHDLYRVFKDDEKDGKPGWENVKYLFLGNYIGRGRQGLEIVMALFCIKMLYPDRIFLLRGNHEFLKVNANCGFNLELHDRYCEETYDQLFFKVNEAFAYLSVAAIVGNTYFCAHAGLSPQAFTRRQMMAARKPILDSKCDPVVHHAVWSDFDGKLRGSTFNARRGTSYVIGVEDLSLALYNVGCVTLFRSHTIIPVGFEFIRGLCLSLVTGTGLVPDEFNAGAVAILDAQGKVSFRYYECSPEYCEWIKKLREMDAKDNGRPVFDGEEDIVYDEKWDLIRM